VNIILEMAGQRFSRMNLCKTDLLIDQLKRKDNHLGGEAQFDKLFHMVEYHLKGL
jgi:hypothetical protein